MSDPNTTASSALTAASPHSGSETGGKLPRFSLLILFALVSIVFTVLRWGRYEFVNEAI